MKNHLRLELLNKILNKPYIKTGLILLITVVVFLVLFRNIDFSSVFQILIDSNKIFLFFAFVLSFVVEIIVAKRWQIILKTMDFKISLKEAFCIIMGTFPFALITPSFSNDFVRAVPLQKRIRISKVVGTCFTERFFDFLTLFIFFFIGILLTHNFHFISFALLFLVIMVSVVIFINVKFELPIGEKWRERVNNILLSIRMMCSGTHIIIPVIFYSFCLWAVTIIQTMILFEAVGLSVPLVDTMANLPIAIFIGQIPITFGGAGTRDAAIIFLFSSFASPQQLLAVGILFTFMRCWILAIIGIPFLKYIGLHNLDISDHEKKDP